MDLLGDGAILPVDVVSSALRVVDVRLLSGRPRIARLRQALALVLASWLLLLTAETGPHLVHHLFDTDEETACGFLAVDQHAPAAIAAPALVPKALPTSEALGLAPRPRCSDSSGPPPASRGPPTTPLASA